MDFIIIVIIGFHSKLSMLTIEIKYKKIQIWYILNTFRPTWAFTNNNIKIWSRKFTLPGYSQITLSKSNNMKINTQKILIVIFKFF